MSASLEQLNRAIQADKVSVDKGMAVFREAFEDRVDFVQNAREWGEADARILICWRMMKDDSQIRQSFEAIYGKSSISK